MFNRVFSGWSNASTTDEEDEEDGQDVIADWRDGEELLGEGGGGVSNSYLRRSLLRGSAGADATTLALNNNHNGSESEVDEEFELLVQAYMHDIHYTSRPQAVYHLCYAIINAGIVALPYAAYQSGLPLFVVSILLVGIVSSYTTCIVIAMAEDKSSNLDDGFGGGAMSYNSYSRLQGTTNIRPVTRAVRTLEDLCELAFGKRGYYVVSLFQVLLSLVLMSLSLQIWAEVMQSVLSSRLSSTSLRHYPVLLFLLTTRQGAVLVGSWVVLPLVLRSAAMSSLRWTAYAAVLAVAAGLLSVVYAFVVDRDANSTPISIEAVTHCKSQWWAVGFIVTLCFSYNQKTFSVYSCLRRRSAKRWQFAVKRATSLIVVLYLTFGIFGYLSHIEDGDQLNRFNYYLDFDSGGSAFFDITRSIVSASLLLTMPVDCLVAATTLRRVYLRARCAQGLALLGKRIGARCPAACGILRTAWGFLCCCCASRGGGGIGGGGGGGSGGGRWTPKEGSQDSLSRGVLSDYDVKLAAAAVASAAPPSTSIPPPQLAPASPSHSVAASVVSTASIAAQARLVVPNTEGSEGSDATATRQNSVADIMNLAQLQGAAAPCCCCCWFPDHVIPALLFWSLSVAICVGVENWVVLAATFGSVSTSMLVFLLPSMLYFRLGLSSDFRAAPLFTSGPFAGLIPNQAYMLMVQALGLLLVLSNAACLMYVIVVDDFVQ